MSNDGLITVASRFSVRETIDRLAAAATSAGLLVFARVEEVLSWSEPLVSFAAYWHSQSAVCSHCRALPTTALDQPP